MQEELRRQSVRNEASIAVEDVLTVYGNTPRLSSPVSETPGGIRLSSTLFQRGRMCGAYLTILPQVRRRNTSSSCSGRLPLTASWMEIGHDPSSFESAKPKPKQLDQAKTFAVDARGASQARTNPHRELCRICGVRCCPEFSTLLPAEICAREEGVHHHNMRRPKQCEELTSGISADVGQCHRM